MTDSSTRTSRRFWQPSYFTDLATQHRGGGHKAGLHAKLVRQHAETARRTVPLAELLFMHQEGAPLFDALPATRKFMEEQALPDASSNQLERESEDTE